eukprot:jgi/Tetstr1/440739/TSEL_029047.t1
MTERIKNFLRQRRDDGPCVVVDLDIVHDNYLAFERALPDTRVFYAVKANPAPEILALLERLGSSFDCASVAEIEMERDVARAFELGVRLFAVDCEAEVEKIARAAQGSQVFCRILCDGAGADWPLSRKFGCAPDMAPDVLEHAHRLGLVAHGVSFHVGSQQADVEAWDGALSSAAAIFREMAERGITLAMVNLGGGFPARYLKDIPGVPHYGEAILRGLNTHFGNRIPQTIIEPGPRHGRRRRHDRGGGRPDFEEDGDRKTPCVLAGPTCDSVDVLYEKAPYELPVSLSIGDKVLIEACGAYTTTYSSVAFNGFDPLRSYVI